MFNAAANVLIKAGMRRATVGSLDLKQLFRIAVDPYIVSGVLSFGLALGFYSYTLSKFELSVAYPIMTGLGLVIVFLFSLSVFNEALSVPKVIGAVLILAGVITLSRAG